MVTYVNKKTKKEVAALNGFSASFGNGSFNCILGPSGCGKTTLLKSIIGTVDYQGSITIGGVEAKDISIKDKNIAYVSQDFALYPHMAIFNNIAFPLTLTSASTEEIRRRVREVAEMLGISFLLGRKPKHLSIGQQQRVALARAIIKRPDIYIFDEPFSNLDKETSSKIRIDLKKIVTDLGATCIFVTHDVQEAMALGDELFIMKDGKLVCSGKPIDLINSEDENVKPFFAGI